MKKPSRDPGEEIKRQLRQEVNFGCPVRYPDRTGCGCPVLTFHHFDPPWAGNYIHNPDGMIALCPEHHHQADGGLWSKEQLRSFKRYPFVDDSLKVQWPWQPESLVMKVGPSLVLASGSPIRLDKRPIMRFRPFLINDLNVNTTIFDSDIRDSNGRRWLRITDSWFDLRLENTTDVLFTPQEKKMVAKHNDATYISLKFNKLPLKDFRKWLLEFMTKRETAISAGRSLEKVGAIDSDGNVPVMIIEGSFRSKKVAIKIKGNQMHFDCFIPGLRESFNWHSWVVDDEHRAILQLENGPEFFSLG